MVEIIPKKPKREIPLKNTFVFVAGALLLAAIFGYLILIKLEAGALATMQDLEDQIAKVGTQEDKEIEDKVFDSEKKINDLAVLLANLYPPSQFFDNFENLIHPQVWFSSLELDAAKMQVIVSGQTANFQTLEQQIVFLRSQTSLIKGVNLSDISLGKEGGVGFTLNIGFSPKIFTSLEE